MDNPYRTDFPGQGLFYGREEELALLVEAMRAGRRSIAAVMGGRGMGKTSFAVHLQKSLRDRGIPVVHLVRGPSRDPAAFLGQLEALLKSPLSITMPTESIIEAVTALECARVVLLIDEVECLIASEPGRMLLDNLRYAWEGLAGKLGIVIFGGSALRQLLASDTSPFLRTAEWIPLRGLSYGACAALLREPCALPLPDALVEVLWEQTGGHPLLLQAIMERAVAKGPPLIERLPEAIRETEQWLDSTIFPIWWDNLEVRGQQVYRRLLTHKQPVQRNERLQVLGETPTHWIEILETTGIARVDGNEVLPRGELFRIWTDQNHGLAIEPMEARESTGLARVLQSLGVHELERSVVTTAARWARVLVEHPTMALKSSRASGNQRLLPEQSFQLDLLGALRQHDLLVEAEALSGERGRSDLKVRWPREPERRACIEVKIWGRNDYTNVVEQLLGYAVPEDDFGCVVMLDRQARPLAERYQEEVLQGGTCGTLLSPAEKDEMGIYPAFITSHDRASGRPIRIFHFLVQLPPDDPLGASRTI